MVRNCQVPSSFQIPAEIGRLSSLSVLDVSHNPDLTTLPDEVGNLPKSCDICLGGLKLNLEDSLVKGTSRDLIAYFHKKLKRAVPYFGLRLMLVGYEDRGKTSLLKALKREKKTTNDNMSTVGINVSKWK